MKTPLISAALATAIMVGAASAGDIDTVRAFYSDILTAPAETTEAR